MDDRETLNIDLGHNTEFNWCVAWCNKHNVSPYIKENWTKAKTAYMEFKAQ